jgi:hypothetical protein
MPGPLSDKTYIYSLICPITAEARYVGKSDNPYKRLEQHTAWVRRWKWHANTKRIFPNHEIPLPDPRTSAKGAWLWALDRRGLEPKLAILEQVPLERARDAERFWTERLIEQGHRLTNGERRSFDARQREERAIRDAIEVGRKLVASP